MRRRFRKHRLVALVLVAALVAAGSYAYANAVSGVTPPRLGSGSGPILKYTLSAINYNLDNNGDANNIATISFTLTGATTSTVARIRVTNYATWYACSSAAAPTISCTTTAPQITATGSTGSNLVVVATG